MRTRAISIQDIGFGDSGKGLFVDALVRRLGAKCVVRFNGGGQAGHNVVELRSDESSRHHTFSQTGSGSFVPNVTSVLLHPFVLHPGALLIEVDVLKRKGVTDALSRLHIDGRCRITTPYHQAAGCLREKLRGQQAHGTCGTGFGETVEHSISHPQEALCYGDLMNLSQAELLQKLERIRLTLFDSLCVLVKQAQLGKSAESDEYWQLICDPTMSLHWLNTIQAVLAACPARTQNELREHVGGAEWVIFEGAQGVLLDEWSGFHPHTTWSTIHTDAVDGAALFLGLTSRVIHMGVMRSYLTRHGAGPFPSHDVALSALAEPHNVSDGWQGEFRRGHPDALLLQYGARVVGNLSALVVSHLDVFEKNISLSWVRGYRHIGAGEIITSLPCPVHHDLDRQADLTCLLNSVQPVYEERSISTAQDLLEKIKNATQLPIWMTSRGPYAQHVDMNELLAYL